MTARIKIQSRTYERIETSRLPIVGGDQLDPLRRSRALWRAVAIGLVVAEILRWVI